jgi:3-methyladenine DNA glycosylase AlkD
VPSESHRVVAELLELRSDAELLKVRNRLPSGEEAFGLRMRDLFETAKAHREMPLDEVDVLLNHPAYEPRLAAFCILDFKAQRRISDDARRELYDIYLRRHDSITSWDMVDRAAPRVVGGYLAGRSLAPLHDLAGATAPLRRRTAITAPLYFVKAGGTADLDGGFDIAARLAADPEPVVHNAVGIFLKHAGTRSPEALDRFLHTHAATMPRAALRLAIEKLIPAERNRYLRTS